MQHLELFAVVKGVRSKAVKDKAAKMVRVYACIYVIIMRLITVFSFETMYVS